MNIPFGKGICYSGYREGQGPGLHIYPSEKEVLEDLLILSKSYDYIRMYDPYTHCQTALKVIKDNKLPLKVLMGLEPRGEISNPNCPWGGLHSDEEIKKNLVMNYQQLDLLADLCVRYKDIVLAASVGNESTSSWHSNLMNPSTIAAHARYLKEKVTCPITFCEGVGPWLDHGQEIAEVVDFISVHSYPVWAKVPINEAFKITFSEVEKVKQRYPNKPVVITEFGWPTESNYRMKSDETNEANQKVYLDLIDQWVQNEKIVTFIFEAFDEPWKGSSEPNEPEKHWGIFEVTRKPKTYAQNLARTTYGTKK